MLSEVLFSANSQLECLLKMVASTRKFVIWPFLIFGLLEAVQVYENTLPIESDTTVSGLKYR